MSDKTPEPSKPKPAGGDYWSSARNPWVCLLFLLPLLAVYEAGVLKFGTSAEELRNGADYWMRSGLRMAGVGYRWALPAIVIGLLLVWQIAGRYRWRASIGTLVGMSAESVLFGFCLIVLGQLQELAFRQQLPHAWLSGGVVLALPASLTGPLSQSVSYVGAGIYEEVLFRLCLLPILYGFLRLIQLPNKLALVTSVIATSVAFAAAHYVGPAADPWSVYSFTFRLIAGGFFAVLFVTRGFGITVGAHAAYDLLVGVVLPQVALAQS